MFSQHPRRTALHVLHVQGFKRQFRAMQQDPQVIAVDAELAADFVLVTLFEEDFAEQTAVSLRKVFEDFANFVLHLFGGDRAYEIYDGGGEVLLVLFFERCATSRGAIVLEQYVVAE